MYKPIKIREFLRRKRVSVHLKPEEEYKLVTVKLHHKGVVLREKKNGALLRSKMYRVDSGDFILSGIDARNGAFGVVPPDLDGAIVTNDFWYFDIDEEKVERDFFYWLTTTPLFLDACQKSSKGETQRIRLQKDLFVDFEFHFPPISEQKKFLSIFRRIEKFLSVLNEEIDTQHTLLTNLRQAILQEAVEGKLTAGWRKEQNEKLLKKYENNLSALRELRENNPEYSARALLEKIKAEKEQLVKEGKIKKQKPLPPISEDDLPAGKAGKPFDLPEGWIWCSWENLLSSEKYSMKRGPFGSSLRKSIFVKKGIRVFEQYNAINDDPYWSRYYITPEKYNELKAFTAKPGDLLISCSGVTLGRITELPTDAEIGIINQALLKLNLNVHLISNAFFKNLFRSSYMQKNIFRMAWGIAIPNMIGVKELKKILIAVPPLAEQQAIVEKVDRLMAKIDDLEEQVKSRKEQAEQLMQAVLREAFNGD